jgi:putative DNA primase/helicase
MLGNDKGYAMNMKPETLAQKQNNDSRQASGDIARLKGCRFLNSSEPPKRLLFDAGLLKTLLGRDTITARHLHEREFEYKPVFKLFMNCNYLPVIQDDTLFSSGRINVILFNRHFEPEEQDKSLKDKLQSIDNIAGIFNWCLDGLRKYYSEGINPPEAVNNATADYRSQSDKIGNFISESLEKSSRNSKAGDVYRKYQEWCLSNGYGAENKQNFFAELKSKGLFKALGTVNGQSVKNVVIGYIIEDSEKLRGRDSFITTDQDADLPFQ